MAVGMTDVQQRRIVRHVATLQPLAVLDALIAAVVDNDVWRGELDVLRALRSNVDLEYRRRQRRPGRTTAAQDWIAWFEVTYGERE